MKLQFTIPLEMPESHTYSELVHIAVEKHKAEILNWLYERNPSCGYPNPEKTIADGPMRSFISWLTDTDLEVAINIILGECSDEEYHVEFL